MGVAAPKRVLIFSAVLLAAGCKAGGDAGLHESKDKTFVCQAPEGWTKTGDELPLLSFETPPDGRRQTAVLWIVKPTFSVSRKRLEWVLAENAKNGSNDKAFSQTPLSEILLDGHPALSYTRTHTQTFEGPHIPDPAAPEPYTETVVGVTLPDGRQYKITFSGPSALHDEHKPDFDKFVASCRFNESKK